MVEAIEEEWRSIRKFDAKRERLLSQAHEALASLAAIEEES
jgi:hypothetical protein